MLNLPLLPYLLFFGLGHILREVAAVMTLMEDPCSLSGVLEANFVEPAHDKQGFERTTVLSRLESRLLQMQKNFWYSTIYILSNHLQ